MSGGKWHLRTVRDGKVRIRGRWFRPSVVFLPYDGRLDGHRFLFGTYPGMDDLLALWGTEECYRATQADPNAEWLDGPEVVGGALPWQFWHAEDRTPTPTPSEV